MNACISKSVGCKDSDFDIYLKKWTLPLRPPRGLCEAHLHLAGKPYVIATISSQTYRIVLW